MGDVEDTSSVYSLQDLNKTLLIKSSLAMKSFDLI